MAFVTLAVAAGCTASSPGSNGPCRIAKPLARAASTVFFSGAFALSGAVLARTQ
jgi:hypothetical protein